ncbi:hypothetical protein Tdes44962_MAKER05425 [Teratosphaeria destructans]|uniref:F-box domain-containing protein n=1 Tax=Teratosphaeria destructans TaxID=418781 RepID=A0A9W7VZ53_9PEZI|nr:hypothetical protein Tdes44962_MAKER05425 [Teratosphaeria destructans]
MSNQPVNAASVKLIPQPKCYFLQIPPELRNEIYELAFTSDDDDPEGTDLYKKVPPSPSLALACRQIWQEASAVFPHSWKRYWSERRFVIPDVQVGGSDQASQLWAKVSAALPRDSALASITKLRLTNIGVSTNSTNIGASKGSSIIFDQDF